MASYTIFGSVKYLKEDGSCGGYVTNSKTAPSKCHVLPYFRKVLSSSSPSKWSTGLYYTETKGYYSVDISDNTLHGSAASFGVGDKVYLLFFWSPTVSVLTKDSDKIEYAAFVEVTVQAGDQQQVDVTLLPTKGPVVTSHAFPPAEGFTRTPYTMSEVSKLDEEASITTICNAAGFTSVAASQKHAHDGVNIFGAYRIVPVEYSWSEIPLRTKTHPSDIATPTSDTYAFNTAGVYPLQIAIRTGWHKDVVLTSSVKVRYNDPSPDFDWSPTVSTAWDGKLKGQELITFANRSTDIDGRCSTVYTYDWSISDTTYTGVDATVSYTNKPFSFRPTHRFASPGEKTVTLTCHWHDGFVSKTSVVSKVLTISPFVVTPNFVWSPNPEKRSDVVTFTSTSTGDVSKINDFRWDIDDSYPASTIDLRTFTVADKFGSKFGQESPYSDDSVVHSASYIDKHGDNFAVNFHSFSPKNCKLTLTYSNGWVDVKCDVSKVLTPTKLSLTPNITISNSTPVGRKVAVKIYNTTVDPKGLSSSVDWVVSDFYSLCNLDNPNIGVSVTDHTQRLTRVAPGTVVVHNFQNTTTNTVELTLRYDDGWQEQTKRATASVTPVVFSPPSPNFTWEPTMPISRDETVTFTNLTDDPESLHRASVWSVLDYYAKYNPNNPDYGKTEPVHPISWVGVRQTAAFEPTVNFQSGDVPKKVTLTVFYDDGFCERDVRVSKNISFRRYTVTADFTTEPESHIGKTPVKYINTTPDVHSRQVGAVWDWHDREKSGVDHLTTSPEISPHNTPNFTWQFASRNPYSCTTPALSANLNKDVRLSVRYDDGWGDHNFTEKTKRFEAKTFEITGAIAYHNTVDGGSVIYGRELVEFSHKLIDPWSAVRDNTTDWRIADAFLSGVDNTTVFTNVPKTFTPTKRFESKGHRLVTAEVDFNDGWNTNFTHHNEVYVDPTPYTAPVLDFDWTPANPVILQEVTFHQHHDDVRVHGKLQRVFFDIAADGTLDSAPLTPTEDFAHIFTEKVSNIPVKLIGQYWDGWEEQETFVVKDLSMANIPPSSSFTEALSGVCVPLYHWTATSTDPDDDVGSLSYLWSLERYTPNGYISVVEKSGKDMDWTFQEEGLYRIALTTIDINGESSTKYEDVSVEFGSCATSGGDAKLSGSIELEPNVWQLVAIPVQFGYFDSSGGVLVHDKSTPATVYNYVIRQIESVYGKPAEQLLSVCNAYIGDDNFFRSYIPGFTAETSPHNFPLVYVDDDAPDGEVRREVVAFWVRSIHTSPIIITWGEK